MENYIYMQFVWLQSVDVDGEKSPEAKCKID